MQAHQRTHARGVDVSSWQGTVDWPSVRAAGYSFAFLKASEGVGYTDPAYARNVAGARSASLVAGAYHFARPDATPGDAEREAAYFASVVKAGEPPDMLAVDLEAGALDRAAMTEWAVAFLEATESAFPGVRVAVYCGPAFITQRLAPPRLARWPLWLVEYTSAPAPGAVPGWTDWTFWQWSNAGSVPGVRVRVDLDEFAGSEAELRAWIRGAEGVAGKGLPLLVAGDTGLAVQVLQRLLADRGYYRLAVDGIFGEGTLGAVKAFQAARKLTVDGRVGDQTWGALAATRANGQESASDA
ncbi:MAG: peptidoglycan-binding protein [Clostridia bacterium]|nr:peptidoglycan-binding protein [Clostridia bacterium]MCL6521506.1 peptidoglycan-binding protein [Bacillota bacterium]